ncbi:hypothetical protein [Kineococcus sp. SYSU DK005]|uniref:hypothetical protein n=1 Tax=Kineococcus sp. SYSU DK005 TaxID=3383126 RepID=UPI003D7ECA8B
MDRPTPRPAGATATRLAERCSTVLNGIATRWHARTARAWADGYRTAYVDLRQEHRACTCGHRPAASTPASAR